MFAARIATSNIPFGKQRDKYLKKLHVVFADGKKYVGVDAFIYVWQKTNGYEWLAKIVSLPGIKQIAIIAYSIIAFFFILAL